MMTELDIDGLRITGPHFKATDRYLSKDGDNPEAPWQGYGWPLGTECWYFHMESETGSVRYATGKTVESAEARARKIASEWPSA